MPRLSIIIVTYNSRREIDACLASLSERPPRVDHGVVVVDNASSDGTADHVRQRWPGVRVVEAGGELVTKEQLLQRAWPGLVVEEANVYVTIAQLRKVLGVEAVATVGGLGYRLAFPVACAETEMPRHNLPAERTEFVGRQAVISEAQRRLERTRLLTLIGIGGTGKTRLALKVAEFALADYRHGVRWVHLAPLWNADTVGPALALTLGCTPNGSTSAHAAVAAY